MSQLPFYHAMLVSINSARSVFSASYSREPSTDGGSVEYTDGQENNNISHKTENNQQNSSPTVDDKVPCSPISFFHVFKWLLLITKEQCSVHASILNE